MASGNLLYSTGSSAWCSVMTSRCGMRGKWEGGSRQRGYKSTYSWFMLLSSRKQHNISKQLYSNKLYIYIYIYFFFFSWTNNFKLGVEPVLPLAHWVISHIAINFDWTVVDTFLGLKIQVEKFSTSSVLLGSRRGETMCLCKHVLLM